MAKVTRLKGTKGGKVQLTAAEYKEYFLGMLKLTKEVLGTGLFMGELSKTHRACVDFIDQTIELNGGEVANEQ